MPDMTYPSRHVAEYTCAVRMDPHSEVLHHPELPTMLVVATWDNPVDESPAEFTCVWHTQAASLSQEQAFAHITQDPAWPAEDHAYLPAAPADILVSVFHTISDPIYV